MRTPFYLLILLAVGAVVQSPLSNAQQIKEPNTSTNTVMNADSPEAKARSDLFESIAKRKGFVLLSGKYGGDFQSDQLAIHVENGLTMLLLGLKVTLPNGDLQLDQSSMGGYQQFSRGWILAVVKFLSADQETKDHAEEIRKAFEERKLSLFLLVLTKPSGEVKFLRITLPE